MHEEQEWVGEFVTEWLAQRLGLDSFAFADEWDERGVDGGRLYTTVTYECSESLGEKPGVFRVVLWGMERESVQENRDETGSCENRQEPENRSGIFRQPLRILNFTELWISTYLPPKMLRKSSTNRWTYTWIQLLNNVSRISSLLID